EAAARLRLQSRARRRRRRPADRDRDAAVSRGARPVADAADRPSAPRPVAPGSDGAPDRPALRCRTRPGGAGAGAVRRAWHPGTGAAASTFPTLIVRPVPAGQVRGHGDHTLPAVGLPLIDA